MIKYTIHIHAGICRRYFKIINQSFQIKEPQSLSSEKNYFSLENYNSYLGRTLFSIKILDLSARESFLLFVKGPFIHMLKTKV